MPRSGGAGGWRSSWETLSSLNSIGWSTSACFQRRTWRASMESKLPSSESPLHRSRVSRAELVESAAGAAKAAVRRSQAARNGLLVQRIEFVLRRGGGWPGPGPVEIKLHLADGAGLEGHGTEEGALPGNGGVVPLLQLEGNTAAAREDGADLPGAARFGHGAGLGKINLPHALAGDVQEVSAQVHVELAGGDALDFSAGLVVVDQGKQVGIGRAGGGNGRFVLALPLADFEMAQFDRAAGGLVLHDKAGSKVVEVAEVGPAPDLRAIHQDGKAAFFLVAIEGEIG